MFDAQINNLKNNSHLNAIVHDLSNDPVFLDKTDGILSGKSIAIKENIHLKGIGLSCASKILQNYKSIYNATVVERIKKAGGAILATTNMDEFAMGSSSEHTIHGVVKNPHDITRVAGGSSGGSAVAVASGMVDLALGSDTGGSVRQPSAFCGIYGLKPTYGRISRFGLVSYASSFDQIGIFSNNVKDMSNLFESISGNDEKDSTSALEKVKPYLFNEKKYKIGLPEEYWGKGIDPEMRKILDKFIAKLKSDGHDVKSISMPKTEYSIATYYILTTAEASSNLARFDGVQYGHRENADNPIDMTIFTRNFGFGDEVKRRILLGTFVLSSGYYDAYFEKAQKMRRLIQKDFKNAFEEFDILLTPTVPTPPFKIGEKMDDPLTMYLSDIYTVPMSLAGVPALNLPIGETKSKLPVCIQAVGDFFNENELFNFAELCN
ncbi:MAG: Asp-tRNA(Asn)/Glu-tRNA(Gln) amidotransferase subunit GatA [Candidatus Marinimicrobia bacterium]|nr:Asp-tRNA(Asn)/Glu-tRNA(Gln) amidotransferase subunit GatA [Candidatus Neomarinimicrobiota bacterium]